MTEPEKLRVGQKIRLIRTFRGLNRQFSDITQTHMALILCLECGRQVSTEALACPQCGAPPKRPLPSRLPTVASPGEQSSALIVSDIARQELLKLTKIGLWEKIRWGFLILSLASAWHSPQHPDPMWALLSTIFGILVLRSWSRRCTFHLILKQGQAPSNVLWFYFHALWSFSWRSICTGIAVGLAIACLEDDPRDKATVAVSVPMIWFILSLFVLDVPFWGIRKVRKIIDMDRTSVSNQRDPTASADEATKLAPHDQAREAFQVLQSEGLDHIKSPDELKHEPTTQPESLKPRAVDGPSVIPPTREQWIRQVREAEIAVAAIEKKAGRPMVVWQFNLNRMRSNPPRCFSPSRPGIGRVIHWIFPKVLDDIIMKEWAAGRPPKLPPYPGQEVIEGHLRKIGIIS